jgi:hypothetical protein
VARITQRVMAVITQPLQPPFSDLQQEGDSSNNATKPSKRPDSKCYWLRKPHRRKTVLAKQEPSESQHRQAEQEYWTRALRKQRNLNLFTFLGVIAAGAAFIILWLTLSETRLQTEQSNRPWVKIDPIQHSGLTVNKDGSEQFSMIFAMTNTGHSPSTHVHLEAQLFAISLAQSFTEPVKEQKIICDRLRNSTNQSEFSPFTLFPDQTTTRNTGMSISQSDLMKASVTITKGDPRRAFMPIVVGCVDYQFTFEGGHHQTGFAYDLVRLDPNYTGAPFIVYAEQVLAPDRLQLDPFPFGDLFYAD